MYPIPSIPINRKDKDQIGILSCRAIISAFLTSSSVALGGTLLNSEAPKSFQHASRASFLDNHGHLLRKNCLQQSAYDKIELNT
jgi:hypothetical protein